MAKANKMVAAEDCGLEIDFVRDGEWLMEQCSDEHDDPISDGADLTEICVRGDDGVYRAPLSRLIDRGTATDEIESDADELDAEDMMHYRLDLLDRGINPNASLLRRRRNVRIVNVAA